MTIRASQLEGKVGFETTRLLLQVPGLFDISGLKGFRVYGM